MAELKRGAVVMFYDRKREATGRIAGRCAKRWCEIAGYDLVLDVVTFGCLYNQIPALYNPYLKKLDLVLSELHDRELVIYADADVLFKPYLPFDTPISKFPTDLSFSHDDHGICAGFFVVRNTRWTLDLMKAWRVLGIANGSEHIGYDQHDQGTMKLLMLHFPWIEKAISQIPRTLVSSRDDLPNTGKLAHHFWCAQFDEGKVAEEMAEMERKVWGNPATA